MRKQSKRIQSLREKLIYFAAFIVFIVPLIVFIKKIQVYDSAYFLYGPIEFTSDFFTYYKAMALQFGAVILLIGTVWIRWKETEKSWKLDLFEVILVSFAVVVILSFCFSQFKSVAWSGWIGRFEGTATWLSYISFAFCIYNLVRTKKEAYIILGAFMLSTLVISIIGVFQFLGMDFYQTELGERLILGSYYENFKGNIDMALEKGTVYGTLYNPNYIGSLVAFAFPIGLYLISEIKSWVWRLMIGIVLVFQLIILAGSKSTTGFVALTIGVIVYFIMFIFQRGFLKKRIITGVLIITALVIGVSQTNLFQNQYDKLINSLTTVESEYNPFINVSYDEPVLTVTIDNGDTYHIEPVGYDIKVYDKDWNLLEREDLEDRCRFRNVDQYDFLVDKIHSTGRITVSVTNKVLDKGQVMRFELIHDTQFSVGFNLFTEEKINNDVEVIKLSESERLFTNRGYIWNRSIPLIMSKPLLGYGADTYILNFPHMDLIGRPVIMTDQVVDKPHNIYVQLLINFGFVGGILFLCLVCYTLNKMRSSLLIASLIGWLVVGIANDSVVFVTYMVFCMMGLSNLLMGETETSE